MSFKIAVASSDGKVIDEHFGKAKGFLIFEIKDNNVELIEERKNNPICAADGHKEELVNDSIKLVSDCEAVFTKKIGMGPALALQASGVNVYELSCTIGEAIEKFIKWRKAQN